MESIESLSPEEKEYLAEIINQISTNGSSEMLDDLWAMDYYEKPVSIIEFLTNDEYLGKSVKDAEGNLTIYDYWIDKLQKMFDPSEDNPIQEVALSGCIGSGKSTCAVIGMCYFLYKLLCLKSPASYYHLATNSTIALAFFNVTLNQCYGVGYAKLQNYCKASPWFLRHGKVIGRTNPTYIPDGIEIVAGSKNEHFIGRDIFCAMLDEIDFAKGQDAAIEKSALMKLYSSVKSRINSRFMRKGRVPGLLFLVSSKNNVYDFLETYINMNRDNPRLMIIDEPLWVVKASVGNYSGETFKVAVGNRYYPSKILTDRDDWEAISKAQRVIDVPVEHYEAFKLNLNLALADVAGIAIVSASKYFNIEKVLATYRSYLTNPFVREEISLGFDDDSAVKDFLDESYLPKANRGTQSYHIHWDTSKNGDRTGLSMTTSSDHVKVNRLVKGEIKEVVDVIHKIVFAVAISAVPGEEIPFYKIREFVYWLRDIGFNIASVTCDSFQSIDTIQQFKLQGFNSYVLSVDRSKDPYTAFRNAVNEGRVIAPRISLLEAEYADVEDDPIKNKIDHTPTGCLIGTTEVLTWKGRKAIKDLTEDDVIFSCYKGSVVSSRLKNLRITKYVDSYLRITVSGNKILECTPEHPVLAPKKFTYAKNLFAGTSVVIWDAEYRLNLAQVLSQETIETKTPIPVYDIEVPLYSNFILANGLIVHNSKDVLDSVAANIYKAGSFEAPPITSNTANSLIDINEQETEEDLENWILPPGMTVVEF